MARSADLAVGLVIAAFGAAVIVASRDFRPLVGASYGAGLFPTIIGLTMAACGLIMAVRSRLGVSGSSMDAQPDAAPRPAPDVRRIGALAWLLAGTAASIWLLEPLGFIVCCGAVMASMLVLLRVRPVPALLFSVALATSAHLAFVHLLHVPIPAGVLASILR